LTRKVEVGDITIGGGAPLVLIAGTCVIESEQMALETADAVRAIADDLGMSYVFKSSFDKANRTSPDSFRGPGLVDGLAILARVKRECGVPITTDVHTQEQLGPVAEVADLIQIPAFLSRQTDLLVAAAQTGRAINIKKGQFLAPEDMAGPIAKVTAAGNENVMVTERGHSFGYNRLVVDITGLPAMRALGYPVIFDATHSVQQPGGAGTASGGDRDLAPPLARAAVAAGVDGLFMEVHPDPDCALCDGPNSICLAGLREILEPIAAIDSIARGSR
jgi:2-dehydro-3-deoxyphosphooctonate aldolase (KDO 8-P synthase)